MSTLLFILVVAPGFAYTYVNLRAWPVDPYATLTKLLSLALECPWTLDAEMIYVRDVFDRRNADGAQSRFSTPHLPLSRHYFHAKGDSGFGGGVVKVLEAVVMPAHYVYIAECTHHYITRSCVYKILGLRALLLFFFPSCILLLKYISFQFSRRKNFHYPFIWIDRVYKHHPRIKCGFDLTNGANNKKKIKIKK